MPRTVYIYIYIYIYISHSSIELVSIWWPLSLVSKAVVRLSSSSQFNSIRWRSVYVEGLVVDPVDCVRVPGLRQDRDDLKFRMVTRPVQLISYLKRCPKPLWWSWCCSRCTTRFAQEASGWSWWVWARTGPTWCSQKWWNRLENLLLARDTYFIAHSAWVSVCLELIEQTRSLHLSCKNLYQTRKEDTLCLPSPCLSPSNLPRWNLCATLILSWDGHAWNGLKKFVQPVQLRQVHSADFLELFQTLLQ